jgi:hypothetical protein
MAETLTVTRLGIRGALKRTRESTNPCESMIECVRRTSRNVKPWQSGDMALRWTAAGMLEAEQQFRRVIGYRDLAKLAVAIEQDLTTKNIPSSTPRTPLRSSPPDHHTRTVVAKFHDNRDILEQDAGQGQPLRRLRRRQDLGWVSVGIDHDTARHSRSPRSKGGGSIWARHAIRKPRR